MKKITIGVMGPGESATQKDIDFAYEVGKLIAGKNWTTLTGGMKSGVMHAAVSGAKDNGGITIGILPHPGMDVSDKLDIQITTDLGSSRNSINILSSDIIVVVGMSAGTSSEVSFSLQKWASKPVILLNCGEVAEKFFKSLHSELVNIAETPEQALSICEQIISK